MRYLRSSGARAWPSRIGGMEEGSWFRLLNFSGMIGGYLGKRGAGIHIARSYT